MAARWWQHENEGLQVCNYETDDEAELMEENFGNEGEDDDPFRGRLAEGDLYV